MIRLETALEKALACNKEGLEACSRLEEQVTLTNKGWEAEKLIVQDLPPHTSPPGLAELSLAKPGADQVTLVISCYRA